MARIQLSRDVAPWLLTLLRVVSAALLITSGTTKMFGWPAPMPAGMQFVLLSQVGLGAVLETFGGGLLLLGLGTRPIAFILSGMMAVAYFQFHAPRSFWPTVNEGLPAILLCLIYLYLFAAGPGKLSLDAAFRRKR
jgi:putative oxidoreductase